MLKIIVNYISENPTLRRNELDSLLLEVDFKEIEQDELKNIIKKNNFLTSSNYIMQQLFQKNEESQDIFEDLIEYKNKILSYLENYYTHPTDNLKYTYGIIVGLWFMYYISLGINFKSSQSISFNLFTAVIIYEFLFIETTHYYDNFSRYLKFFEDLKE
jgi:hypothetical protein